jgi:COMPASS component BRE2
MTPDAAPECSFTGPDREIGGVHLDWQDRSTFLRMSPSALTCTAEKGFRSARTNVGVREGTWYFECTVLKGGGEGGTGQPVANQGRPVNFRSATPGDAGPSTGGRSLPKGAGSGDGAHVRIGWARREASLNGPCGLDAYSYGIRDSSGEKITISRPAPYGVPFGTGDVIGCLIHLPPVDEFSAVPDVEERERKRRERREAENDSLNPARIARKRYPLYYKGQHYFEMVEYTVAKEMENLVARDGRVSEPAIKPGTDVNAGIAAPVKETNRNGMPVQKSKAKGVGGNGPMTKHAEGGKLGKAIKKGRKKAGDGDEQVQAEDQPKELPVLKGSRITFFLNGKPMTAQNKPAFEDILHFLPLRQTEKEAKARQAFEKGTTADALMKQKENPYDDGTLGYYPFVSCFGGAKVKFNPGPVWEAPVADEDWPALSGDGSDAQPRTFPRITPRPINERWPEFRAEERIFDDIDDEADMKKLKKFEADKRKERRESGSGTGPARGGKRSRGAAKKGGKNAMSSLATEIFDRSTVSGGSSPFPDPEADSFGVGHPDSRGSTPAQTDYGMDIDTALPSPVPGSGGFGLDLGIPSRLAYETDDRE